MHVASRPLCQELWILSGWTDTEFRWYDDDKGIEYIDLKGTNGLSLPAYDLGYLWRRFEALGNELSVGYDDSGSFYHFHYGHRGTGRQISDIGFHFDGEPQECIEDAFCEFFIDLLKANTKPNNAVKPPIKDEE